MNKPTRIIKKPYKEKGNIALLHVCDNGKTYSLKQLAGIVGITSSNLRNRIRKMGWDNPDVLKPPIKPQEGPARPVMAENKPRSHNLEKIPGPTPYEREMGYV